MENLTPDYLAEHYVNLADAGRNARTLYASDEFFAPAERMLDPGEPVWKEGVYDDHGKWMDGWESRRKRGQGHDFCIVRLVGRGRIRAVDIDTRYFTGNYPPVASVDACCRDADPDGETAWTEIVPPRPIGGDRHNVCAVDDDSPFTHLRLNIYPDGGVARLRVYGVVEP